MNLRHAKLSPALLVLTLTTLTHAQKPSQLQPRLLDGKPLTVTGKLAVRFRGWHHYVVVETPHPYLADIEDASPASITEIELNIGDDHALAMHAGETVTTSGKLQMDTSSPYYYNGVMLMIDKATFPGATVTRKPPKPDNIPATVDSYLVTTFMMPHRLVYVNKAVALPTGKPVAGDRLDHCSLQGSGELLNCSCAEGFDPTRAGVVPHALDIHHTQQIPAAYFALKGIAQFSVVGDDDQPHALTYQVVCNRKKSSPTP